MASAGSLPFVVKGNLNNITVIFHGETHSDIDNRYYEKLQIKPDSLLFVEHSTNACELKPEEEHLFQQHAKGTEWIFYTQKKRGNPNVICFNTRAEQGYMNAFQEKRLIEIGDRLDKCEPPEIREYVDGVMASFSTFKKNAEIFNHALPGYLERSLEKMQSQLKLIITLLRLKKTKGDEFPELFANILSGVGYTLATNIRRVASVSVDISLIGMLLQATEPRAVPGEINVFCGRNHAVRISALLPFTNIRRTRFKEEYVEQADIEVSGSLEEDKKLLELAARS
jgi:hypothetical protein